MATRRTDKSAPRSSRPQGMSADAEPPRQSNAITGDSLRKTERQPLADLDESDASRQQRIALAAYYRAQRRGFEAGGELEDWLAAEQEIDARTAVASDPAELPERARDVRSLGPSDSSDSGSDLIGPGLIDDDLLNLDRGTTEDSEGGHLASSDAGASLGDLGLDSNTDRNGTGEHLTAGKEPHVRIGADIAPDRIVGPEEAGLGGGLDQAEEAQLGITDEELARRLRRK
jgi:DUF2934 family protein